MGVRDLLGFLKRHGVPLERHRPAFFADKTIAVDGYSLFFHLYYAAKKEGFSKHREEALHRLDDFLKRWPKTTTLIFVLDSPIKSELKKKTLDKRREAESAIQKELIAVEAAVADEEAKIAERISQGEEEVGVVNPVLQARRDALKRRSKETFPVVCREILEKLRQDGYRQLVSDGEAEKTACEMVAAEEADYVYSADSDCLALACPRVIIEDVGGFLYVYVMKDVLAKLKLTPLSFTDFCILLGTDFNERILPPEEAYASILSHERAELIPGLTEDSVEKVKDVRIQYSNDIPTIDAESVLTSTRGTGLKPASSSSDTPVPPRRACTKKKDVGPAPAELLAPVSKLAARVIS